MQNVRTPSSELACYMSFGNRKLSAWFLSLTAAALRVSSLVDSVSYYDCKTAAAWRVRGADLAHAYSDSVIALLSPSRIASLPTPPWSYELEMLAYAYANVGNSSAALELVTRIVDDGRRTAGQDTLPTGFDADNIASVYAAIGDTASAMRWLKVGVRQGYSVHWYKMNARLQSLHGTEAFARFVRENDH